MSSVIPLLGVFALPQRRLQLCWRIGKPLFYLTGASPRYVHRSLTIPGDMRHLSMTIALRKRKEKQQSATESELPLSKGTTLNEDPDDLRAVQDGIASAISRLKDDLSKLRAGGRVNTDALELLRVQVSKKDKETARLGELAQIVPRGGRMITVLVSEQEHIKPIMSAIVGSDLSLTPQPDQHNSLQLNVPVPPPTKESRAQSVQMARKAWEIAASAIRDSRASMHRHLQTLEKKKIARADDVRRSHDRMEKIVEKGQKEAKDLLEAAKKALESI